MHPKIRSKKRGVILGILIVQAALFQAVRAEKLQAVDVDWLALIPQKDLDAMEAMPEISHEQPFDQVNMPKVMFSTSVVDRYEHTRIRIAGYMVPLETNEKGGVTEFFFAPYMGACIHVPPPPPNQLIHVTFSQGIVVEGIWFPFEIEGVLSIETFDNGLGAASYSLKAEKVNAYDQE